LLENEYAVFHPDETDSWIKSLIFSEETYLELLKKEWTPQQARSVLPNSLKTELIMTGTVTQWQGFFKLRCALDAHPQARELAIPLHNEFVMKGVKNV
jgi:thymidylate synthase (FAD)